jgi:hypothetical protein
MTEPLPEQQKTTLIVRRFPKTVRYQSTSRAATVG